MNSERSSNTERRRGAAASAAANPPSQHRGDFLPLVARLFGQLQQAAGRGRDQTADSDIVGFVTRPPAAPASGDGSARSS